MTDTTSHVERSVLEQLDGLPVNQTWLIDHLSEKHGIEEGATLTALHELMERGEVHYNLDWNLTLS